jgi:hypothetical protein
LQIRQRLLTSEKRELLGSRPLPIPHQGQAMFLRFSSFRFSNIAILQPGCAYSTALCTHTRRERAVPRLCEKLE